LQKQKNKNKKQKNKKTETTTGDFLGLTQLLSYGSYFVVPKTNNHSCTDVFEQT